MKPVLKSTIQVDNMIRFKQKGDFSKSFSYMNRLKEIIHKSDFDKYGRIGVEALMKGTPVDTGKTAKSWDYEIERSSYRTTIYWTNNNINEGVSIAVILQYGHATGWGSYVEGIDYINPVMKPVFKKIAEDAWEEVTSKL